MACKTQKNRVTLESVSPIKEGRKKKVHLSIKHFHASMTKKSKYRKLNKQNEEYMDDDGIKGNRGNHARYKDINMTNNLNNRQ